MTTPPVPYIEIDGRLPSAEDLVVAALYGGYGHFTAMQVRDGRVRGLALHLARLDANTAEVFGTGLDGDLVRARVRHALDGAGTRDASVRVYVQWAPGADAATLMVTVRAPMTMSEAPQALMSVPYERPFAHIKHLGGFAQTHYGALARRAGFDDALLTGPGGVVVEGAITNIGFYDGTSVTWPDAPALLGITMALVEPRLPDAGLPSTRGPVTLDGLSSYRAAFVTNSQGIAPVRRIDDTEFTVDPQLMKTVASAYDAAPWDRV
ncbi:aminotransferase class IV family protein [Streptomyces sp. H27-C3]|uniref:aminotransferase class IV family protein n=1 Tax=Streptomyces sp. H27-C3 TaxID=3046305 RepID=UPI0024B90D4C|nr:aminotransferase class IV family protein [Streptomyces sp. H27-C3]MDJ0464467.1 aminotransferase class IV family protein [Streptomyces sp. H27-C3]